MNGSYEQLQSLLQLMALPVTGQVRLLSAECCRLEVLAGSLIAWRQQRPAELVEELTPAQVHALEQLERQLARTLREAASPLWTDTTMRRSDGCRQVRRLARQALASFGWYMALPAPEFLHTIQVSDRF